VHVALIVEDLPDAREWLRALIAKGFTTPKVGELLSITKNTAAGYVKSIYAKRVLPRFYGHFRFFNAFVEGR
jgi:DNA-binding NarL/FixJ family response regulator